uniref:Reverse transcriptase RNase H-like domain-containing protein n=1 Tax=Amphimedon queenslandica TaxID=400682 RepID=A0A1X7UFV5_AMPQE
HVINADGIQPLESKVSAILVRLLNAIKHFCYFVEGHVFTVYTDHKPLTYSLHTKSNKYSPQQIRHLDYISKFTSDIRHIQGKDNPVADALSRVQLNAI